MRGPPRFSAFIVLGALRLIVEATLIALATAWPTAAHAQSTSQGVEWTLPGSGEDASFYPCDAGVLHAPLAKERQCRFQGTDTLCHSEQEGLTFSAAQVPLTGVRTYEGAEVSSENEGAHVCACASEQAHRGDFARYELGLPLAPDGSLSASLPENSGGFVVGSPTGGVVSAERLIQYPNPNGRIAASFADPLSAVSFALGSESFGAQYFLDLCYLGTPPVKQNPTRGPGGGAFSSLPSFTTSAFLALTNPGVDTGSSPTGGVSRVYEAFAGIKGNWDLVCSTFDTKGPPANLTTDFRKLGITDTGQRRFPATLGTSAALYDAPPTAEEGWVGNLNAEIKKSGDFSTLGTQVNMLFGSATTPLVLTQGREGKVPRACRLRLYFWEAASGRTRAWQQGGARFTVKWTVQGISQ